MPLYDFICDCGVTEEFAKWKETPRCKVCGKLKRRVYTAPYVKVGVFKGEKKSKWLDSMSKELNGIGMPGMERYYNKDGTKKEELYKKKKWSTLKNKSILT